MRSSSTPRPPGSIPAKARIVEIAAVRLVAGAIDDAATIRAAGQPRRADSESRDRKSTASTTQRSPGARLSPQAWPQLSRRLRRRPVRDRPLDRLRSCDVQARMRARRHACGTAAHARHAVAAQVGGAGSCAAIRSSSSPPGSGSSCGPPFGARRRRTTARIFIALLPKLRDRSIRTFGGGRAGAAAPTRGPPDGSIAPAGPSRLQSRAGRTRARPHRQLSLPPPHRRRHERAAAIRRGR